MPDISGIFCIVYVLFLFLIGYFLLQHTFSQRYFQKPKKKLIFTNKVLRILLAVVRFGECQKHILPCQVYNLISFHGFFLTKNHRIYPNQRT